VIQPVLGFWKLESNGYAGKPHCPDGFAYTSGTNERWVNSADMKRMILELNLPGTKDLAEAWKTTSSQRAEAVASSAS
jgi:hypothetical protein